MYPCCGSLHLQLIGARIFALRAKLHATQLDTNTGSQGCDQRSWVALRMILLTIYYSDHPCSIQPISNLYGLKQELHSLSCSNMLKYCSCCSNDDFSLLSLHYALVPTIVFSSATSLRALEAITHIPHGRSESLHLVCLLEVGRSDSSVTG